LGQKSQGKTLLAPAHSDSEIDCNGLEICRHAVDKASSESLIYSHFVTLCFGRLANGIQEASGSSPLFSTKPAKCKALRVFHALSSYAACTNANENHLNNLENML